MLLSKHMVYIVKTIGMSFTVMIKEIVHFFTATRVEQIMLTHIIKKYLHHRMI